MTTELCKTWLGQYIPRSMDQLEEYEKLIFEAQQFERTLQSMQWTQLNTLHEWCSKAGELWGKQHKIDVLDRVRVILRTGVVPYVSMPASPGALEYEDVVSRNGSFSDWTWDDDWGNPTTTTATATTTTTTASMSKRRKQRHSQGIPRIYECTAISAPLLTLLGSLLQEYTHLPNLPVIQSALQIYPNILRDVFALFRAGGGLFGSVQAETPLRLTNDCFYLSGEIGLMSFGMGHLGFIEIKAVLEELSQTMDSSGVSWRERYFVFSFLN
jgi:hypothetical protein